ncbi:PfkB family carbohydrate kinase [Luteolibacter sp. LG18]|uniref:PfkB family carbohydrate kinase n=1 Tax=Luteolibacter sp. LG18 TaxID=2819286 RepID=UPI002B310766|nr:adenosine kinase [Luteolibacter sp. LG18]
MATPSAILVGGTIAIDHVKTPAAEAENLLGGSASYAALAASYFTAPVHLVGIVGQDFPPQHLAMLESHGVTLEGVERSEGDSFAWSGEYHENMNDRTTRSVSVNVLENWEVKVPASLAASPIVVLANMSPDNQLQMLDQCTAAERFVVADTMDLWINIARERLHEVLKRIDLLVINEGEARDFMGTSNLILAGRRLLETGPRNVVIKLGEFGAMLFSEQETGDSEWELSENTFFRCAAFPLREVADPTGAGDTFLGGLAGHLAATGKTRFGFDDIRRAVVQGSVVASFTCEAFSTRRLESLDEAAIGQRLDLFKRMSDW